MSIWTHVVGCIRVDGIKELGASKINILKIIGPMSLWDKWDDSSILPSGSEGSLQYELIEYSEGLPWLSIPIWGDLRDFDDPGEIETWWNELLPKLGFVRDAVLLITVEGKSPIVLTNEKAE